jgi:hypothetical protein
LIKISNSVRRKKIFIFFLMWSNIYFIDDRPFRQEDMHLYFWIYIYSYFNSYLKIKIKKIKKLFGPPNKMCGSVPLPTSISLKYQNNRLPTTAQKAMPYNQKKVVNYRIVSPCHVQIATTRELLDWYRKDDIENCTLDGDFFVLTVD